MNTRPSVNHFFLHPVLERNTADDHMPASWSSEHMFAPLRYLELVVTNPVLGSDPVHMIGRIISFNQHGILLATPTEPTFYLPMHRLIECYPARRRKIVQWFEQFGEDAQLEKEDVRGVTA